MGNQAYNKAKKRGLIGEKTACEYLVKRGYTILCANFHSRFGEIDIVARKNNEIIFCEVKTRSDNFNFGTPEEALTHFKLKKMILTVYDFLNKNPGLLKMNWRINLIAVMLNSFDEPRKIVHYRNVEI